MGSHRGLPYGFCGRKAPRKKEALRIRAQELCEGRGGRRGLPCGFCGRKAPRKKEALRIRAQELCEGRGGRRGLPCGFCGRKAPRKKEALRIRAQELCEGRGGRRGLPSLQRLTVSVDVKATRMKQEEPCASQLRSCVNRELGLGSHSLSHSSPVPNKPYSFCGRKAAWTKEALHIRYLRSCVNKEVGLGSHSLSHSFPVPDKPYSFCGRKTPRQQERKNPAPGVGQDRSGYGQDMAAHASSATRNFFLSDVFLTGPFNFICSESSLTSFASLTSNEGLPM